MIKFSKNKIIFLILIVSSLSFINGCEDDGGVSEEEQIEDILEELEECVTRDDIPFSEIVEKGGSGESFCVDLYANYEEDGYCTSFECVNLLDAPIECGIIYDCEYEFSSGETDASFDIGCCIQPNLTPEGIALGCTNAAEEEGVEDVVGTCLLLCDEVGAIEAAGWTQEDTDECMDIVEEEYFIPASPFDYIPDPEELITGLPSESCSEFGEEVGEAVNSCPGCCDVGSDDDILAINGCCYAADKAIGDPSCKLRPLSGYITIPGLGDVILEFSFDGNILVWVNVQEIDDFGSPDQTYLEGISIEAGRVPNTDTFTFEFEGEVYSFEADVGGVCTNFVSGGVSGSAVCETINTEWVPPSTLKATCRAGYVVTGLYVSDVYEEDGELQSDEVSITCCNLDVLLPDFELDDDYVDLPIPLVDPEEDDSSSSSSDSDDLDEPEDEEDETSGEPLGGVVEYGLSWSSSHSVYRGYNCSEDEFMVEVGLVNNKCAKLERNDGTNIEWGATRTIDGRDKNCAGDEAVIGYGAIIWPFWPGYLNCAKIIDADGDTIHRDGTRSVGGNICDEDEVIIGVKSGPNGWCGKDWFWNY